MRQIAFAIAFILACTVPFAAQEKKLLAKPVEKMISLSGCVVRIDKTFDQFTLEDAIEGKYWLSGIKLQDFVGKRVQVGGVVIGSKRLVVKGGLLSNPNVVAQAGAMDPVRAAVAALGGSAGPGTVELPEFKVRSVRPVIGGCSD